VVEEEGVEQTLTTRVEEPLVLVVVGEEVERYAQLDIVLWLEEKDVSRPQVVGRVLSIQEEEWVAPVSGEILTELVSPIQEVD
jgi:hypothetical protein